MEIKKEREGKIEDEASMSRRVGRYSTRDGGGKIEDKVGRERLKTLISLLTHAL